MTLERAFCDLDLRALHDDVVGFVPPRQLDALLTLTTLEHFHCDSDHPFTPHPVVAMLTDQLRQHGGTAGQMLALLAGNTERLLANRL